MQRGSARRTACSAAQLVFAAEDFLYRVADHGDLLAGLLDTRATPARRPRFQPANRGRCTGRASSARTPPVGITPLRERPTAIIAASDSAAPAMLAAGAGSLRIPAPAELSVIASEDAVAAR